MSIYLSIYLVMLGLVATLQADRLVAQSSLQVRHVRAQLVDRPLSGVGAGDRSAA